MLPIQSGKVYCPVCKREQLARPIVDTAGDYRKWYKCNECSREFPESANPANFIRNPGQGN